MAVYYKFKSAKDYHSIPIEGQFISVVNLKERIFETKLSGKGTDFDLMISNAQSNEEYVDEGCMIPKNTSVLIRRVPGRTRKPIAIESDKPRLIDVKVEDLPPSSMLISNSPSTKHVENPEEYEWDVFGDDLYTIREADPALTSNPVSDVSPADKVDEDNRIKALVDNPALDWNRQTEETFGGGRGFGRGGRMMGGRGFGRGMFERKTPPAGYVCHRCRVSGHFIQHCPTNGDPNYDIKKVKPPTGIPKSMLMVTPDGSYSLPSGAIAVLKPNEAAFDKEMEGLTTTRLVNNFPPELHCPLCKEVMKDAALSSKCCLRSFCDKCIRDYIIMNTMCVCGATNILADDLLPNKTVRETINRISESTISCTEYSGSTAQIQDMESAHPMQPKVSSPTLSATSKDEPKKPTVEQSFLMKEVVVASETKVAKSERNSLEKNTIMNVDVTESTLEYASKEPKSPQSALVPGDVQEKQLAGKKKKKKKPRLPSSAADMQWRTCQDIGADNFGVPLAAPGYNSYMAGGMPFGVDSYMTPFGGPMPFMGYTPGPFNVPFGGGILPQDPFSAHGYMMPAFPRDLSGLGMGSVGMNQGPPTMSREEFEARKSDLRRKHEMERLCQRERGHPKDWEARRESSNMNDDASMKPKPQWPTSSDRDRFTKSTSVDRNGPPRDSARNTPPRQATRKAADRHEHPVAAAKAEYSHKPSVFSRIILSESGDAAGKKRKSSELKEPMTHKAAEGGYGELMGGKSSSAGDGRRSRGYDYDSSDDERHIKRRPSASSRREAEAVREEAAAARMSKRSREREFDGRGGGSREAERSHDHLARRYAQR